MKQNFASVSKKRRRDQDERVQRTRARIDSAFVELLHRRCYGDIRIGDITRKARIGRATFYGHYPNKDALLRSQFERIVAPMLAITGGPVPIDGTAFFAHVRSVPALYRALMGPAGGNGPRVLRDCFEQRAREMLSIESEAELEHLVRSRVLAGMILTVAESSLERGARETPQQMQALLASLVSAGLVDKKVRQ